MLDLSSFFFSLGYNLLQEYAQFSPFTKPKNAVEFLTYSKDFSSNQIF